MRTKPTGSLVVCVAAAVFAAGALVLNNDSSGPTPVAATAGAPASNATTAPRTGGYTGQSAPAATAGAPSAAAQARLEIQGFAFSPVSAAPGGRVSIQSRDAVPHTVTADGRAFDSGRIGPNGTAGIVAPRSPGSYRFTCLIHPQMSGTLVVR